MGPSNKTNLDLDNFEQDIYGSSGSHSSPVYMYTVTYMPFWRRVLRIANTFQEWAKRNAERTKVQSIRPIPPQDFYKKPGSIIDVDGDPAKYVWGADFGDKSKTQDNTILWTNVGKAVPGIGEKKDDPPTNA